MNDTVYSTRKRITFMFLIFAVLGIILLMRVFYVSVIWGPELKQRATSQQTMDSAVTSKRGTIFDRNKKALAISATVEKVCAVPVDIDEAGNAEAVATHLSRILELDYEKVYKQVSRKDSYYEIIKRGVEKETADEIRALELVGVRFDEDSKRYYPYGNFLSHVIGFAGVDNQGLEGLEARYDSDLKGTPGRIRSIKDGDGRQMPHVYEEYNDPVPGRDLTLTIDEVMQHYVEKHLEAAVIENNVENGASCIVMNPETGEILAMASKPDYDLNNREQVSDPRVAEKLKTLEGDAYNAELRRVWRNKAVVDSYEPGSTFKILTASMALEEQRVSFTETFNCGGAMRVATSTINCHKVSGHGIQTFRQGVENSCNPVFITLGERIGADLFVKYFGAFGLTQPTKFELPGEASGIFWNRKDFNIVELATGSFGQGFQITPLQMITAVSAVANEGKLMKPYIVDSLTDADGNQTYKAEPQIVRQMISRETSDTMRDILEGVVSHGTGQNAYVKGFRVAGKTGTSEKNPRGTDKRIASFIGFAPADDPKIVCLLMLDEPNVPIKYGGTIAAPVVAEIIGDIMRYMQVEPQYTEQEKAELEIPVPNVINMGLSEAKDAVTNAGFTYKVIGEGDTILDQIPKASVNLKKRAPIVIYTESTDKAQKVIVPNVLNRSALETNTMLTNANLNIRVSTGRDLAANTATRRQDPPPGTEVLPGTIVYVDFRTIQMD